MREGGQGRLSSPREQLHFYLRNSSMWAQSYVKRAGGSQCGLTLETRANRVLPVGKFGHNLKACHERGAHGTMGRGGVFANGKVPHHRK
jgi:hypothetical protein